MFKYSLGKRVDIKLATRIPEGEAGEMLTVLQKLTREDSMFIPIPKDKKEADELENRYRARIANWRKSERIPMEIGMARTDDHKWAIYFRIKRRGRPVENGTQI